MATKIQFLDPGRCAALATEELALLHKAFMGWTDTENFTDAMVAATKEVFRKVFRLPVDQALEGSVLPDAIVLHTPTHRMDSDAHVGANVFYALVEDCTEPSGWEPMIITCSGTMAWAPGVSMSLVVSLLKTSACRVEVVHENGDVIVWDDEHAECEKGLEQQEAEPSPQGI